MKKIVLLLSVMGLVGCGTYTIKNNWVKSVKAGGAVVESGECSVLSDAFLFGVFPVNITDESDGDLPSAKKDVSYEAGNYVVTADGAVEPSDEDDRCEVGKKTPTTPKKKDEGKEEEYKPFTPEEKAELDKKYKHLDDADAEDGDAYWENLQRAEEEERKAAEAAKQTTQPATTPAGG